MQGKKSNISEHSATFRTAVHSLLLGLDLTDKQPLYSQIIILVQVDDYLELEATNYIGHKCLES